MTPPAAVDLRPAPGGRGARGPIAALRLVPRLLVVVAGAALVLLAGLLIASTVRRYVVGRPIADVEDAAGLLFVAVAFLPMAQGYAADRQLRVQFLFRLLPQRWQRPLRVLGDAVTCLAVALLAYETWRFAEVSRIFGSRIVGSGHLLWPWMMIVPLGFALLAVTIAVMLFVAPRPPADDLVEEL